MKNKKYQQAIHTYESQCQKALDRLIKKIEPDLRQACEKWGFDFWADMGSWTLSFGGKHTTQKYRKSEGRCYPLGDPRFLMDFLQPELADVLETKVDGESLGSLMPIFAPPKEDYEWVIIQADWSCLDEPTDVIEIIKSIDRRDGLDDSEYAYFGWVPKVLAEAVLAEYNRDWTSGSQLLASLPDLRPKDFALLAS